MINKWDYNSYSGITLNGIDHCAHCAKVPEQSCCEDHHDSFKDDDQVVNFICTCEKCNLCSRMYEKKFGSR